MWYTWTTLLLVSCTLVRADEGTGAEALLWGTTTDAPPQTHQPQTGLLTTPAPFGTPTTFGDHTEPSQQDTRLQPVQATSRAPSLTLDRKASELAWRSWLQSPESGNQNAPPRRIITKSLFITPLVCPKGQRLDRNGCVQVVTVNKDEHERILLEQLNALFPTASSGGDYDYGDDEPGPLQLTLPIGLDPQAAPLQGQEPSAQAQGQHPTFMDKKDNKFPSDASIEAELELLKLQHAHNHTESSGVLNHNVMNSLLPAADKPKRDSPVDGSASSESQNITTDEGQKEIVYGHVNVDPVMYGSHNDNQEQTSANTNSETQKTTTVFDKKAVIENVSTVNNNTATANDSSNHLKKDTDKTKLNPENDYSDIGEAIKLISRYAEVTTDDDYAKNQKKYAIKEESTLGTRTKIQYRRNRPKPEIIRKPQETTLPSDTSNKDKLPMRILYPKNELYYRYPLAGQHSPTPPPNYPFRHLQDYWPGSTQIGGVYNTHENPRRHHHSYPHYFRPRAYRFGNSEAYSGQESFSDQNQMYAHRVAQRHASPSRFHNKNQELYNLLGLRHWFSNEGTTKR